MANNALVSLFTHKKDTNNEKAQNSPIQHASPISSISMTISHHVSSVPVSCHHVYPTSKSATPYFSMYVQSAYSHASHQLVSPSWAWLLAF